MSNKKNKLWLPSIFSANMMLQADKENLIWGKARAGGKISMTVAGKKVDGKAGKDGRFRLLLPAFIAGGP
jgi:sialate O-acetylesterase